jgi:hypothetical protein
VMTCFTGIYITAYLYLYYRWMLNYDEKWSWSKNY